MSKIFKKFSFIFWLITFLVIPQFLNPSLANITIDDSRITVTHSPNPVHTDDGQVTFIITSTVDLPTGIFYTYQISTPDGKCTSGSYNEGIDFTSYNRDPRNIQVTSIIPTYGCLAVAGNRKFELWAGNKSGNQIVFNYPFYLEQVGGGNAPEIVPLNQNLGLSETPEVEIHNAKSGTTYTFWWDSSTIEIANHFTASYDGNSGKIAINKVGVDFSKAVTRILCMEVGHYITTSGLTCHYKATFNFSLLPPLPSTDQPSCSIDPPGPTENKSVSVKAINLPKNEDFKADLIIGSNTINLLQKQSSGDSGIVSIPLAASLVQGSYTAKVYNATNNNFMCGVDFTIGPPSISTTSGSSTPQISGGTQCGSGADPAIATAIGCVHTSPVGLVKDFLRFILGIGGGLAFLMMLLGAFQMLTSAGNPETLQAGRDRLQSAVIGLLFIIFSILLLRIIGVDILGLGGQFGFK